MGARSLIERLARAETDMVGREFIAPVLPGGTVHVRLEGLACRLRVEGGSPGWSVLRPVSTSRAAFVRTATQRERREYLSRLPAAGVVALHGSSTEIPHVLAALAAPGDHRFRTDGPVRVHFAQDVRQFDRLVARFDGLRFWFDSQDRRRNPAVAAYLRSALRDLAPPGRLAHSTLTAPEREAYTAVFRGFEEARRDNVQLRLGEALGHASARLLSYIDRGDSYVVRYLVDGVEHTSAVDKNDLTVVTAGICLSGEDRKFDLQSLVGVMRESRVRGRD